VIELLTPVGPAYRSGLPAAPALIKTGANTLSVAAGTVIELGEKSIKLTANMPVTMPTLTPGEDYSVWITPAGAAVCVADPFAAPAAAPVAGSRKIGGFHYGLVAAGVTVAGGSFATTGSGMIWTQADVDKIAGINAWSIWDLGYRPACPNPRGMARTLGGTWVDLYLTGPDHVTAGTSRAGTAIASGTVLPKMALGFGGTGANSYTALNAWIASEIARSHGKRLLWEHEFSDAAFGVTEGISIGGASETYPATLRNAGYTSKYGAEQLTGHIWQWGLDSGQSPATTTESWSGNGRGSVYSNGRRRALFGGSRADGSYCGSRCVHWSFAPSNSFWFIGMRAACDHLQLA
jgi:hypothetical protein